MAAVDHLSHAAVDVGTIDAEATKWDAETATGSIIPLSKENATDVAWIIIMSTPATS